VSPAGATVTVPAALARCTREGLHIEIGNAAEEVTSATQLVGERSIDVYREPVKRQREVLDLLEKIDGETPDPPLPIEVDLAHRSIFLRALEEQQRGIVERLGDLKDDEQRAATERAQELDALVRAVKTSEQAAG